MTRNPTKFPSVDAFDSAAPDMEIDDSPWGPPDSGRARWIPVSEPSAVPEHFVDIDDLFIPLEVIDEPAVIADAPPEEPEIVVEVVPVEQTAPARVETPYLAAVCRPAASLFDEDTKRTSEDTLGRLARASADPEWEPR